MTQLHSSLLANHRPYAAVYADEAERLAATGFVRALGSGIVAFATEDLYKEVLQVSDYTVWILTNVSPVEWTQLGRAPVSSQFSGIVDGGQVVWESAYTFRVSAASYFIQGVLYSSTEQTITLDAADATLDRIDVLALNTSGTLVKVTGTAAAQPSEPDIDPTVQLKLTFVFVAAASTSPNVTNEDIYLENTEWTSSTSGSGWNANSTNNPRTGTKTIEGTNVANGAYVQLQRSSATALDDFASLVLFIRSKATWNNNRVLRLQFFNAGVAKGSAVTIASGYWGFDSSNTSGYQLVAISLSQFVIPAGTLINQLRITDSGGSIGLYIDDITLQSRSSDVAPTVTMGITQDQADARYVLQTLFAAHATQHENGGSDEIDVTGLSGLLADPQVADKIKESSGPTTLTVGAVADGEFLKRSGSTVVSGVPSGTGAEAGANSDITSMDGLTGAIENPTKIIFPEAAAPATPGANKVALYAKSDGKLYIKDDAGTETDLTATGTVTGSPFEFTVAVSDETTSITTGTAKITFYFPVAVNITGVSAGLTGQSSSGAVTIDVNKNGTTIFSTNLTIDANEDTSHTAATPAALSSSPTAFSVTDKVTIDIDGAGTSAEGLKVSFTGTRQ
jgi:hypothetical protein